MPVRREMSARRTAITQIGKTPSTVAVSDIAYVSRTRMACSSTADRKSEIEE
jgi:hypothetical protein